MLSTDAARALRGSFLQPTRTARRQARYFRLVYCRADNARVSNPLVSGDNSSAMIEPLLFVRTTRVKAWLKWLMAPALICLVAVPASAAPITWRFDATPRVDCFGTCPAHIGLPPAQQFGSAQCARRFVQCRRRESRSAVKHLCDKSGPRRAGLHTTWTSGGGGLEIDRRTSTLGAFNCFGCMAPSVIFGNSISPLGAPGIYVEFRHSVAILTDALPVGLTPFRPPGVLRRRVAFSPAVRHCT